MRISGKYKIIAYCIYLTAVTGLFLFLLFPEAAVRDFIKRGVTRIEADMQVDINEIKPLLPPGVKFKAVSVLYKGKPIAKPEYIRITPRLWSLLGNQPRFFFKADVFSGIIEGNCRLLENRDANTDIRISGVNLKDINQLCKISKHQVDGRMNGKVKVITQGNDFSIQADMDFSDLVVILNQPVFGMQRFLFDTVKADLSMTPRRLEIKAGTIEGQAFDGDFTGDILIKTPFNDSILNLRGFIRPQAAFIKEASKTVPLDLLMKKQSDGKGLPVKLRGTIREPQISLR